MTIRVFCHRSLLAALLLVTALFPVGHAATIALIGTEELLQDSELVFDGEVVAVRPEINQYGRIYTFVEFQINEVLLGEFDPVTTEGMLELRFTGGTALGIGLDVGVRIPELGERGIYFVEQVAPGLINPLLGWEQGHFIVNSEGVVVAGNDREVRGMELQAQSSTTQISSGVAKGIATAPAYDESLAFSVGEPPAAMSVTAFKNRIRELAN